MPTLASTNRAQLSYKPEATPGTPVTATACYALRMTGESLSFDVKKESDKEIRSDRQRVSSVSVSAQAGGGINIHMQYAEYDVLLAALLQSTWVVSGTLGVTTSAGTTYTATTINATATLPVVAKGQWLQVSHPLRNSGAEELVRVSSTVAPTTSIITLDASTPLAVVGSGSCVLSSSRLTNGTTLQAFTLQRKITDIAVPLYQTFKGMFVSKFNVTFNSAALTEGSFDFLGFTMTSQTTSGLHATVTAATGNDIQNAVTGVGNVWEGGVPLTSTFIKSLGLTIDNSLRPQEAIGTYGLVGVGVGTLAVSGTAEIYFADGSLFDKFLADVYTSFTVSTKDVNGNGYVFSFPRVKLTSGKVNAGGKDADLMASFTWEAFADINNADPTLRQTLFIDRFGDAVTLPT